MSNNNEESSKTNGMSSDPLQRLPTFKSPRDLTLGGNKPQKKVFTPNLNVSRNKNKPTSKQDSNNQKKDDRAKKDRKNDKNKNFRNGPNVIRSGGVFSQGLGQAERTQRQGYERPESSSSLPKPKISVKDVIKIDKELEEKKIKAVLGDYSLNDNVVDSFRNSLSLDAPIRLPIDEGFLTSMKKRAKELKKRAIKQEPAEDGSTEPEPIVDMKMDVYEDTDILDLLKSDQPTMVLLQLPETLPGRGTSGDGSETTRRKKPEERPSTSSGEGQSDDSPKEEKCYLQDLDEGRIATIRIHRSGRVTMAFGDTILDVSSGTRTAFFQEVMSVAVDDPSRSANLLSLGPLVHRVITEPDWASLIGAV